MQHNFLRLNLRSWVAILLFTLVTLAVSWYDYDKTGEIYSSDMAGYYAYLPALFIHQDLDRFSINHKREPGDIWTFKELPNGKRLNKYTIGVAAMSFPFFFIAHIYANTFETYPPDGYSPPYQIAGMIAAIFWTIFGLVMLLFFLRNYFSDQVVAWTLTAIALGTNLFYYTAYEHGMSHTYSFALFATMLYLTHNMYVRQSKKYIFWIAFIGSMIILVRQVNAVLLLLPLLWNVYNPESLVSRINLLTKNYKSLLGAMLIFVLPLTLQTYYWHYATGHWIVYSYGNEYFDFFNPHIIQGLFSFRKGWFLYTPMALFATIGFIFLWIKDKKLAPSIFVLMVIVIYVTFSWWMWWYGGSFGCRPLIEYLALMSIPLAALFEKILYKGSNLGKACFFSCIACIIALNIFQQYQYSVQILHWDRMTRAYYFKTWGKIDINHEEYEKYLLGEREYWDELQRISKINIYLRTITLPFHHDDNRFTPKPVCSYTAIRYLPDATGYCSGYSSLSYSSLSLPPDAAFRGRLLMKRR